MKNLQRLLIAAAFASIMPSTVVLCSEESTGALRAHLDTAFLAKFATVLGGSHGFIAGAQGVHALKSAKRKLFKANNLTPETLTQLKKGIRNNRIGMVVSLAVAASPFAIQKFNGSNIKIGSEPIIMSRPEQLAKEVDKETA